MPWQVRFNLTMKLQPIGHIETPYKSVDECPKNVDSEGPPCALVLEPPYEEALDGLKVGDQILILYWFGGVDRDRLRQLRRGEGPMMGTFALRSPHRPNPIAAAVLPIVTIDGNRVAVRGMDCLDGTPLIDIKPAIRAERRIR
jgi:tRNA-Thr(GGU) m(6)t(6)A37 methyltransferase TsaA